MTPPKERPTVIEKYRPSNATEGDAFTSMFCSRCTKQVGCEILGMTMMHDVDDPEYPAEWIRDGRKATCTAFEPVLAKVREQVAAVRRG